MRHRTSLLLSCAAVLLASSTAFAQSATMAPPAGGENAALNPGAQPRNVDEIVVTAQKREQSLQDVPIVVNVVTAQQLQDAGVRDIKDLTVLTPGLMVTST